MVKMEELQMSRRIVEVAVLLHEQNWNVILPWKEAALLPDVAVESELEVWSSPAEAGISNVIKI